MIFHRKNLVTSIIVANFDGENQKYKLKMMKKGKLIMALLMAAMFCTTTLSAQDIRDRNNSTMGRIESNGTIRDRNNSTMGSFSSDGTIRDRNNSTVGRIDSNGTLRDRNNSTIGRVDSDGTVRDRNNSTMGRISSDGTVRDRNNSTIGYARNVPVKYAAVWFFFGELLR